MSPKKDGENKTANDFMIQPAAFFDENENLLGCL